MAGSITGSLPEWLEAVRAPLAQLIASERGREVCALVVALPDGPRLIALRSVSRDPLAFAIPEYEWARVERWVAANRGIPLCFVHSHPDTGGSPLLQPSDVDRDNMAATRGIPWVIVGRDGL